MKVYLIPGLGFDHRIYQKLDLGDANVHYLDWIEPQKGENISHYAKRLAEPIDDDEDNVLIGHSMGGMMSREIAAQKNIHKIILVSSIRSRKELPRQFKIMKPLGLHRFMAKAPLVRTVRYWGKGQDYDKGEEQDLFRSMVGNQSNRYLRWALKELSRWREPEIPSSTQVHQIHGSKDKTFPAKLIHEADEQIEGAGHFMVYKYPSEISAFIQRRIQ